MHGIPSAALVSMAFHRSHKRSHYGYAAKRADAMGKTPQSKIDNWLKATGLQGKGPGVVKRVVAAGEYCERTCRLSEEDTLKALTGIDFSHTVTVVRLPLKCYVQYKGQHVGRWFTDIGLTPDAVGLALGTRKRVLFVPSGAVYALKCTARSIRDNWTIGRIFDKKDLLSALKGVPTRGGGIQYLVHDRFRMDQI